MFGAAALGWASASRTTFPFSITLSVASLVACLITFNQTVDLPLEIRHTVFEVTDVVSITSAGVVKFGPFRLQQLHTIGHGFQRFDMLTLVLVADVCV